MDIRILFKGLVIGFSIAAPVGPIGVLCIRRTLAQGRLYGFISGLGAATADAIYGIIAGFGLTFISNMLINQQVVLRVAGGVFLCYLGIKTVFLELTEQETETKEDKPARVYASTFFLTLTNPMTIISFAAIFAGLGLSGPGEGYASAVILVLGVFLGSSAWWMMLSGGVGLLRERLDRRVLGWVNRLSGIIITGFGLFALASVL